MKPIEINARPSPALMVALGTIHILAIVGVWALPWLVAIGLTILILGNFIWCWHHKQTVVLKVNMKGELFIKQGSDWLEAKVLSSSLVLPYLTVLNLKLPDRHRPFNVVLLPDSVEAKDFRRLRVWLKWGETPTREDR